MPVQTQDTAADIKVRQALRSNVINIMSKYKDPKFAQFYLYQQGFAPEDIENEINQVTGFSQGGGFANAGTPGKITGTTGTSGSYAEQVRGKIQELPVGQQEGAFGAISAAQSAKRINDILDKGISTGPISGRAQKFSARFLDKASPDFIDFNSATTAFTANFIKALSGVQVSDREREFLMNALPAPEKQEKENRQGMQQLIQFLKDKYEFQLGMPLDIETIYGTGSSQEPKQIQSQEQVKQQFKGALDWAAKNPNNPAAIKLMQKLRTGEIDPTTGQKKTLEQKQLAQEPKEQPKQGGDFIDTLGNVGQKLGSFFGGNKIGEALGNLIGGKMAKYGEAGDTFKKSIAQIEQLYQDGKIDQAKRDKLLKNQEETARDAFGYNGPSFTELAGDAAQIALTLAPGAGMAGKATKAISKIPLIGKVAGGLGKIATGAALGYGYDIASGLKEGEGAETFKPGSGAVIGAAIPVAGGTFKLAGKGLGALSRTLSGTPKKAFEYVVNNPGVLNEKVSSGKTAGDELIGLVNKVKEGFGEVLQKKNLNYQKALSEINTKYAGKKISNTGLMDGVKNVLGEFDSLEALPDKYKKLVNKAIETVNSHKDFSPRGYDILRMKIKNLQTAGEAPAAKTADTILGRMAGQIKQHVESVVPEVAKMNKKYGNDMDVINNILKDLKPEGDKKALLNRLIKVFDDNSPFQREAVEALGEKRAKEIYDTVARKIFSEWIPIGGIGRVLTSLGVGGATVGAMTGGAGVLPAAAGAYAMGSPKLIGKIASMVGKTKQVIGKQGLNQFPGDVFWKSKYGKDILEKVKSARPGMTIQSVANRTKNTVSSHYKYGGKTLISQYKRGLPIKERLKSLKKDEIYSFSDFTDYTGGSYRPEKKELNALRKDVIASMNRIGMKIPKTDQGIANSLGKILEKLKYKRYAK